MDRGPGTTPGERGRGGERAGGAGSLGLAVPRGRGTAVTAQEGIKDPENLGRASWPGSCMHGRSNLVAMLLRRLASAHSSHALGRVALRHACAPQLGMALRGICSAAEQQQQGRIIVTDRCAEVRGARPRPVPRAQPQPLARPHASALRAPTPAADHPAQLQQGHRRARGAAAAPAVGRAGRVLGLPVQLCARGGVGAGGGRRGVRACRRARRRRLVFAGADQGLHCAPPRQPAPSPASPAYLVLPRLKPERIAPPELNASPRLRWTLRMR